MISVQGYTIIIKNSSIGQNRHRWSNNDGKLCSLCHANWSEVKKSLSMLKEEYGLKGGKDFIVSHGEELRTGQPDLKNEDFQSTACTWLHFDKEKMSYELYGE